jgi:hypothetical protein
MVHQHWSKISEPEAIKKPDAVFGEGKLKTADVKAPEEK